MKSKILTTTALVAAMMATDTGRASADIGDAIAGGIIGGIIGGAINNSQRTRTRTRTVVVNPVARQQAREVQTALNYFNWPVGVPDGVLGRNSRAGISSYQAYLGFAPTGTLADIERTILLSAYQRAQLGGPQVTRIASRHRDGVRGLLEAVRDEMLGGRARTAGAYGLPPEVADAVDEVAASSDPSAEQLVQRSGFVQLADLNGDGRTDYILDTSVTGSAFWCNAQACTVQVFVSTPDGYVRNDFQSNNATPAAFDCLRSTCTLNEQQRPSVVATGGGAATAPAGDLAPPVAAALPLVQNPGASPATTAAAVPNLFSGQGSSATQASLSSHCNRVALVTSANGGYVDLQTMNDPIFALNEQFCLARGYAIAEGETLVAQIAGATAQSIAQQCAGLEPHLQSHVAALSFQPREVVLQGVTEFVLASGLSSADLAGTARVCLSSGYQTDNLTVAIGSALILAALGEEAYGELPAHHLMQGIGTQQRQSLAADWFHASVQAPGTTTTQVTFRPGPDARNALILSAVDAAVGDAVGETSGSAPRLLPVPTPRASK